MKNQDSSSKYPQVELQRAEERIKAYNYDASLKKIAIYAIIAFGLTFLFLFYILPKIYTS
jgi:hypothetical protein